MASRGPHPDDPAHLHRRRQVRRGLRRHAGRAVRPTWTPGTAACGSGWSTTGGLRRFVNVYLNDEDVRFLGGLTTPVNDGDTVTVLPAVAGGRA